VSGAFRQDGCADSLYRSRGIARGAGKPKKSLAPVAEGEALLSGKAHWPGRAGAGCCPTQCRLFHGGAALLPGALLWLKPGAVEAPLLGSQLRRLHLLQIHQEHPFPICPLPQVRRKAAARKEGQVCPPARGRQPRRSVVQFGQHAAPHRA